MTIAGSNAYPTHTLKCKDCGIEFNICDSAEKVKAAKCTACGSSNVEVLYMSFGSDGPGFQKDYTTPTNPGCSPDAFGKDGTPE